MTADGGVLRWIAAYTCSVSGDSAYFVTLSWAASRSLGPAAAGVVLAVGAVPRALLMLGGGVVADRFGPRRVLIGSDLVRCVLVVGAALAVVGRVHFGVLAALAIGFGVVDALFMPAVGALPPVLVAADQLARVQGMRVLAVRAANLAGPVLAGCVLGVGGASVSFLAAGALFAASLLGLVTLRIPRAAVAGVMAAFAERVSRPRPLLAGSLALTAALLLAWGTFGRLGAVAVSAALGATTGVTTVVATARLQTVAAPRFLGRVTAVTTLCTLGLSPLLFPLVGFVAEAWGTGTFFALCAVVCGAAAAIGSRPTPSGRPTAAAADGPRTPVRPRTRSRSPRR